MSRIQLKFREISSCFILETDFRFEFLVQNMHVLRISSTYCKEKGHFYWSMSTVKSFLISNLLSMASFSWKNFTQKIICDYKSGLSLCRMYLKFSAYAYFRTRNSNLKSVSNKNQLEISRNLIRDNRIARKGMRLLQSRTKYIGTFQFFSNFKTSVYTKLPLLRPPLTMLANGPALLSNIVQGCGRGEMLITVSIFI